MGSLYVFSVTLSFPVGKKWMCYNADIQGDMERKMYTVDSLKFVVDEKLKQARKQISNLEKCKDRPHVLDDKTVLIHRCSV